MRSNEISRWLEEGASVRAKLVAEVDPIAIRHLRGNLNGINRQISAAVMAETARQFEKAMAEDANRQAALAEYKATWKREEVWQQ